MFGRPQSTMRRQTKLQLVCVVSLPSILSWNICALRRLIHWRTQKFAPIALAQSSGRPAGSFTTRRNGSQAAINEGGSEVAKIAPPVAWRGSEARALSGRLAIGIVQDVARIKLRVLLFLPLGIGRLILVVWVLPSALAFALLLFVRKAGILLTPLFGSSMELSSLRLGRTGQSANMAGGDSLRRE